MQIVNPGIQDNSVTTAKIADGAVTNVKLDLAATLDDLTSDVTLSQNVLTTVAAATISVAGTYLICWCAQFKQGTSAGELEAMLFDSIGGFYCEQDLTLPANDYGAVGGAIIATLPVADLQLKCRSAVAGSPSVLHAGSEAIPPATFLQVCRIA